MSAEIRIYLPDNGDIGSLRAWLDDLPQVRTEPVPRPSRPGEQGDAWEFLSVLCGTGGAATVAVNAISTWLESRVTHARIVIGKTDIQLRGADPEALARLVEAARKAAEDGP